MLKYSLIGVTVGMITFKETWTVIKLVSAISVVPIHA